MSTTASAALNQAYDEINRLRDELRRERERATQQQRRADRLEVDSKLAWKVAAWRASGGRVESG